MDAAHAERVISDHQIGAAAESRKLAGRWLRMSAKDQRAIFGDYLFGRKEIFIDTRPPEKVIVQFTTSFGQDFERLEFSFADIAAAVTEGRRLTF